MKKIISILLSLALALLSASAVFADDTEQSEVHTYTTETGIVYKYTVNNNEATITKITTKRSNLNIPEMVEGYPIVKLGSWCCMENNNINILSIPKTVKEIDENAFAECTGLVELSLSEGLEIIGESAFYHCNGLKELTIPNTVKILKLNCFGDCKSLETVVFSGDIPEIERRVFSGCKKLANVNLDSEILSKEDADFSDAFEDTMWFNNVYSSEEYVLTDEGTTLYKYAGDDDEAVIPEGVTKITSEAFYGSNVKSVTIPKSMTGISDGAFSGAMKLVNIQFSGDITYIGKSAFAGTAFEEFTIPETVENIGERAFEGCKKLQSVKLPEKLTALGKMAFSDCTALKKVNIPDGVKNSVYTNRCFRNCDNITDVTFNGEITSDIYDAFADVLDIGTSDEFVIIDNVLKKYNGTDRKVVIPEGVTSLGLTFQKSDIDTVVLPSTLKKIDDWAFQNSKITEITIPSTVEIIGESAFFGCLNLQKVVVEEGVKQISGQAFFCCNNLSDVTIPKSAYVAPNAFDGTDYATETSTQSTAEPSATAKPTAAPDATETPEETAAPDTTAAPEPKALTVSTADGVSITVDGKTIDFPDAKPFIDDADRTQVPVRAVAEMLKCSVDWDDEIKTAIITRDDGKVIRIAADSDIMTVNGEPKEMDTAAVIKDDRTYIPLRFIAQALGLNVFWEWDD